MILDASAVCSILLGEPEREQYLIQIERADIVRMTAATALECVSVIRGKVLRNETLPETEQLLDELLDSAKIKIVSFDSIQFSIARNAYRTYGKGSGHPAQLNFGDCFSYALAIHLNEPLLFKGNDFIHTDVISANS